MSEEKAVTANAMFAGLSWLAGREHFLLSIVSEIGAERVCAFELCGPGLIVIQHAAVQNSWRLQTTCAADSLLSRGQKDSPLIADFFKLNYSTEAMLMVVAMMLTFMQHQTEADSDNGYLGTARKNEHMFGGFWFGGF